MTQFNHVLTVDCGPTRDGERLCVHPGVRFFAAGRRFFTGKIEVGFPSDRFLV